MTDFSTLTVDDNCGMIGNVREIPIRLLTPGERFLMVLPSGKRFPGTLVRKGPGTVAVVLDHAEKERSFTTREGQQIHLVQTGGIIYWSPGTPVLRLKEEPRDVSRWTTRGGTGVGPNPAYHDKRQETIETEQESAMTHERTAGLPLGGTAKTKSDKKKAGKGGSAKTKVKREPKTLNDCLDGCGEKVSGRFRQGHDARYYSMLKKVKSGDMTFNQLPRLMQSMLKDKQGALRALAASKH